ncbi:MAG: hypothetical protein ACLP19_11245 [Xanthobacteraceae bacterium]
MQVCCWTGVSAISPYATIAGARAVNDPQATNIAQIVISGTTRHTPAGVTLHQGRAGSEEPAAYGRTLDKFTL